MSFHAKVLRVLIASPSDVNKERDEIEEAIFLWNKQYAENLNIVLLPSRWESDVAPAYSGSNPQQIINEELVNKCDIIIGVFWTKIGTPTSHYSSGTLEEINIFIEQKKEVMLYFVSNDIPHETNLDELNKLREYKREYMSKGVYARYDPQSIRDHLYKKATAFKKVDKTEITLMKNKVPSGKSGYQIDELILSDKLTESELMLLGYILDTGNRYFGIGWNSESTLKSIERWQKRKSLYTTLLDDYDGVISNLIDRGILTPAEYPEEDIKGLYSMAIDEYDQFRQTSSEVKSKIDFTVASCCYELPF